MKTVEGDLLEMFDQGDFDIIIHGCNCFCSMGAGIARQIADRYPKAVEADNETRSLDINSKLGNYSAALVERENDDMPGIVINAYTQRHPGPDLVVSALELSLWKIAQVADPEAEIGIPLIGCGLAGGDWAEIEPIIEKIFKKHNVTVVKYAPKKERDASKVQKD